MANRNVTMNTLDHSSAWMWELNLVLGVSVVIGHQYFCSLTREFLLAKYGMVFGTVERG